MDVFRTFPQGWNVNRKNIQPVKQVFAKFSLLNHLRRSRLVACDQACIGSQRARASQAFELPFLEHAQQLGLKLERDLADLI
jgi:hypothetical protein